MINQKPTQAKPQDMSHNVYSDKSVANRNILNHIINSTYHSNLTELDERRFTLKEIFTFIMEFIALGLMFAIFIFFISISDGFDAHIIEWMGR